MNEGEAAELIVNEAREILQNDLGIAVNWSDKNATSPLGKNFECTVTDLDKLNFVWWFVFWLKSIFAYDAAASKIVAHLKNSETNKTSSI